MLGPQEFLYDLATEIYPALKLANRSGASEQELMDILHRMIAAANLSLEATDRSEAKC